MPSAISQLVPNSSAVIGGLLTPTALGSMPSDVTRSVRQRPDERALVAACHAAVVHREAVELVTGTVADLDPPSPRHEAAHAIAAHFLPRWRTRLKSVCASPALGTRGLAAKAALLHGLIDRNHDGAPQGGPAMQVAASLVDDLLAHGWS